MRGNCLNCGGELQPSVTRGSVEKYLQLGLRLSNKYDVGEYLRSRFVLAAEELATLFKPEAHQTDMVDYVSNSQSIGEEFEEHTAVEPISVNMELLMEDSIQGEEKKHTPRKEKVKEVYQATLF